jgi:hypothetical protein
LEKAPNRFPEKAPLVREPCRIYTIKFTLPTNTTISNNEIRYNSNTPNYWATCISLNNSGGAVIDHNICWAPPWGGIDTTNTGCSNANVTISNNQIYGANADLQNSGAAITVYTGAGGSLSGASVSGNLIQDTGCTGIAVVSSTTAANLANVAITNNSIIRSDERSPGSTDGIEISTSNNTQVIGNTVSGDGLYFRYGLHLDNPAVDVTLSTNTLTGAKSGAGADLQNDGASLHP